MAEPTASPHDASRTLSACLGLLFLACAAVLGLTVLYHFSGFHVWDDSYMFARYADNLLASGKLAWNPGDPPTYGLTSLLYLAVVVPARLLAPHNPLLAVVGSSLACSALFLVLLLVLVWRFTDATALGRRALVVITLLALTLASPHLLTHVVSGMDTMFALAYLTAYILLAKLHERRPGLGKAVLLGVWGGVAFLVRPDLMLYSAAVPAVLLLLGPDGTARRHGLLIGLVSALVLAAELAAARAYFGTPLPLPFYAKATKLYGAYIHRWYRLVPLAQLVQFVASFWFPMLLIAMDVLTGGLKDRGARRSRVELGLLLATVLFIGYYLGFVLQIMYMGARFYYPTLPALAFLGAQSLARIVRRACGTGALACESQPGAAVPYPCTADLLRLPRPLAWVACLLVVYSLTPLARLGVEKTSARRQEGDLARFDIQADYERRWDNYWFALDAFSKLPDDLVVATTEVGCPAGLNPRKRLIDLTGLNDTVFALQGFSADRLLTEYRPDLLYLPHPHYKEIIAAILAHPAFREHYELFSAETLSDRLGKPVEMGLALRRDSPHYAAMRRIVTDYRSSARPKPASPTAGQ